MGVMSRIDPVSMANHIEESRQKALAILATAYEVSIQAVNAKFDRQRDEIQGVLNTLQLESNLSEMLAETTSPPVPQNGARVVEGPPPENAGEAVLSEEELLEKASHSLWTMMVSGKAALRVDEVVSQFAKLYGIKLPPSLVQRWLDEQVDDRTMQLARTTSRRTKQVIQYYLPANAGVPIAVAVKARIGRHKSSPEG